MTSLSGASLVDAATAFLLACRHQGLTQLTIETRQHSLALFAGWCRDRGIYKVFELQSSHCLAFQRWLHCAQSQRGAPYSLASQTGKLSDLRAFGRWLVEHSHRQDDPMAMVELPKQGRSLPACILSRQQIARLLEKPETEKPLGLRDRAILEIAYAVGLSGRELASLTIPDFDSEGGCLRIRPVERRRERIVPLGERAREWLGKYLQNARPTLAAGGQRSGVSWAKPRKVEQTTRQTDALFLSQWGAQMETGDIGHIIAKYLKILRMPTARPAQILKNTMAVHALEDGLDLRFLAALFGHADLQGVRKFAAMDVRNLQAIHAKYHPAEQAGTATSSPEKTGQNTHQR